MLASLANALTPSTIPSAILVVGNFGATIDILHVLPEDGSIERFGIASPSTTFHYRGAHERSREQIGTVTLHVGDDEPAVSFLGDVDSRIRRLQAGRDRRVGVTQLVQDILKPAALEAIHEIEGREGSMDATETYPVYLVYIRRSWARRILQDLTSFP